MSKTILPGSTIGVLGSGQLGRMFTIAARRLGYRVHGPQILNATSRIRFDPENQTGILSHANSGDTKGGLMHQLNHCDRSKSHHGNTPAMAMSQRWL
jgi:hypothetical protein